MDLQMRINAITDKIDKVEDKIALTPDPSERRDMLVKVLAEHNLRLTFLQDLKALRE